MTTIAAKVNIWGTFAGAVLWNPDRGYATLEFDEAYLKKNWDLAPITMPLEEIRSGSRIFSFPTLNKETYRGLPGLLSDSLPDKFGNTLIDAWLAQQGRDVRSFSPVERLCYIGQRGMGALEYEPAISPFDEKSNPVEIKKLVKLAKDVLTERKKLQTNIHDKTNKGLLEIVRVGSSAGGARAKAIIAYNEITGDVRSGQIDGLKDYAYWVIKFDGVTNQKLGDPKGYGKIEYAYYLMAKDCGIEMSSCKLLKENKRAHFMSRRFDRDGTKKLHMQTLCAIAHFDYNNPSANSYELAFQIMRQLKLPYTDTENMYRRMVFNVIARNQDDHTKNISFIMDESGLWRLSPAYDLTYAFDPKNKWMKEHQMSINGKRDGIQRKDLMATAKKMNIKKADEIIAKTIDTILNWNTYAKKADVNRDQIGAIRSTFLLRI
ncbi:type II toxin-antitoxin system HipA family toxin [bacterium]|nr:type II toxin-antitoxin system HipA family toxin [bacterium]